MRRIVATSILLTITACSVNLFAQHPDEDVRQGLKLLRDGKYLAAQVTLERVSAEHPKIALQELASLRSFVGDYRGALEAMDQSKSLAKPDDNFDPGTLDNFHPVNAVDEIIKRAAGRQIVILNEAHHVPRHRAFAMQLARRLREEEFTYFAAETFTPFTESLKRNRYPERMTGHYTLEPMFGCLIREVISLGYEPIAYEQVGMPEPGDMTDQINSREETQCQNLIKKIFAKDPKARVFIYVGFSHASEKVQQHEDGRETAWLAARLARETGIDPLTIDQTIQTERSTENLSASAWRVAYENGWLANPVVLVDSGKNAFVGGGYEDAMDVQVFHPLMQFNENGRPYWLEKVGGRLVVSIPDDIKPASGKVLVQAFVENESERAIPFDQIVLHDDGKRPKLILAAGKYRLVVQDETGKELHRQTLVVDDQG